MNFYELVMKIAYGIKRAIRNFRLGWELSQLERRMKRDKKLTLQIQKLEAKMKAKGWMKSKSNAKTK